MSDARHQLERIVERAAEMFLAREEELWKMLTVDGRPAFSMTEADLLRLLQKQFGDEAALDYKELKEAQSGPGIQ